MERSVSGTAMLDKLVAILDVVSAGPSSVVGISQKTGVSRPTVHRLCNALELHRMLSRDEADRRRIGPRLSEWTAERSPDEQRLIHASAAALRRLRDGLGESVQLYIRDGAQRRCIAGLESPHGLRTIVRVGALLPLHLGSAGSVLSETPEARKKGWAQSVEEREKGVASVSAPVVLDKKLLAAVSVSGPIDRMTRNPGATFAHGVVSAARDIEMELRRTT